MAKNIPVRQCVACRAQKEKPQMCRVVRTKDGSILWDEAGKVSGRGAYLCIQTACLDKAKKSRALARALGCEIPDEIYARLRTFFAEKEAQ